MKFSAVLNAAALMAFAAGAPVADAQLSSRAPRGGLFGWLVTWVPASVEMSLDDAVVGSVGSPFESSPVELGSVRAADAGDAWLYDWQDDDRALGAAISDVRSLRSNSEVYWHDMNRTEAMFTSAATGRSLPDVTPDMAPVGRSDDVTAGLHGVELAARAPLQDVTIGGIEVLTTVPEPATYWLAAVGLVVIVVIRRRGMA